MVKEENILGLDTHVQVGGYCMADGTVILFVARSANGSIYFGLPNFCVGSDDHGPTTFQATDLNAVWLLQCVTRTQQHGENKLIFLL
jgi:hypothetical protein